MPGASDGVDTSGDRPPSEFEAPPSPEPFARRIAPDLTAPVTAADVGQATLRPEVERISRGAPGPPDVLAATDVPNRVGFAAAHALLTGRDPGQAILDTARAGGAQPRGEDLLADAGMPEGEPRRIAGRYLDAGLDWRNVVPGLAGGGTLSLGRQVVAEPLGAVVGSEALGPLGQAVGGDTGREVGETVGGLLGAGVAGSPTGRRVVRDVGAAAKRAGLVPGLGIEDVTAGQRVAGEGGAEVERLRLDKFPAAVQDTIARAAERGDFWQAQRRNVIPDAQAEKMADELGKTADDLIAQGRVGRAWNTEETRALRNGLVAQAMKVDDLKATVAALGDQASDALRRELGREEATLLALSRVAEGARAEAGRTFRAYLADTRGRLLRAREPEYTSVSRVPTEAAPELEGRVVQPTLEGPPPEHRLGIGEPVTPAPELEGRVVQAGLEGPPQHRLGQMDVPPRTPAPPSVTPRVTEQAVLPMTLPGETAPSNVDRALLVRKAGMLAAVPTHLVNLFGNAALGALELGLKPAYVGADVARVAVGRALGMNPERQRYLAEWGPQLAGYARGFGAGMAEVPGIVARGPAEVLGRVQGGKLASGSASADTAVELPFRALAASDAVFRGAAFGGHAAALAVRQATQEGLTGAARTQRAQEILGNLSDHPDLLASANALAARNVGQEDRAVTQAVGRLRASLPGGKVAGDVVLPFYKTPINLAAQGAGMTPAGYLAALKDATLGLRRGAARAQVAAGAKVSDLSVLDRAALGSRPTVSAEAADQAVRATVGSAVMGIAAYLGGNQLLTGAYPQDPAERSTLPEGWKPWSVRVATPGGTYYVPIAAFGAMAVPLGTVAVMQDAERKGADQPDATKTVARMLGGMGSMMLNQSSLQDLSTLTQVVTQPDRAGERFVENLASSLVPASGLARTVQQALGEPQRDPNNAVEAFLAGIPGLSSLVPEKQTPLGATRARGPSGPIALLIGSRVGVEQPNSVTAALREADVNIPDAPKTVSHENVTGIPLTEADQRAYRTAAGEEISKRVQHAIDHPKWSQGTPEQRKDFLEQQVRDAREAAKLRILKDIGKDEIKRRLAARPTAA